ncbi:hypothetical protein Hanom_Chr14g01254941 [Helianthus anomalus]
MSIIVCLKFLWNFMIKIWCFPIFHYIICVFWVCFMAKVMMFYDFVHLLEIFDFVADPHSILNYIISIFCILNVDRKYQFNL